MIKVAHVMGTHLPGHQRCNATSWHSPSLLKLDAVLNIHEYDMEWVGNKLLRKSSSICSVRWVGQAMGTHLWWHQTMRKWYSPSLHPSLHCIWVMCAKYTYITKMSWNRWGNKLVRKSSSVCSVQCVGQAVRTCLWWHQMAWNSCIMTLSKSPSIPTLHLGNVCKIYIHI